MKDNLHKSGVKFAEEFLKARGVKKENASAYWKWDDNPTGDGWLITFTITEKQGGN